MKFLLALLITTSAFSATQANLFLKGVVPSVLSVDVQNSTSAVNLPLMDNQTNLKIAELKYSSNSATGFKITVNSLNDFKLVHYTANDILNYTLNVGGVTVGQGSTVVQNNNKVNEETKDIKITYNAMSSVTTAGEYVDTVTFTISAN